MGMFDTIYNTFDIGPGYNNKELQTKAFESFMGYFWLDPLGQLYEIDYTSTHDFVEDENPKHPLFKFTWVPNGTRGRIKPVDYWGTAIVYPAKWDCKYASFPECRLYFRRGVVEVVSHINKCNSE
jgi:hypothetical protein